MKKRKLAAVICAALPLLLLCACAPSGFDTQAIHDHYAGAASVTAEAEISTNSGVLVDYTVSYQKADGKSLVTILAPESLKGITASMEMGSTQIIYDDVSVETLLPPLTGFLPVDCIDGVLSDLKNAVPGDYSFEPYREQDAVAMTYTKTLDGYQAEKRIWVAQDGFDLLGAEFYLDGDMVMSLRTTSFACQP